MAQWCANDETKKEEGNYYGSYGGHALESCQRVHMWKEKAILNVEDTHILGGPIAKVYAPGIMARQNAWKKDSSESTCYLIDFSNIHS